MYFINVPVEKSELNVESWRFGPISPVSIRAFNDLDENLENDVSLFDLTDEDLNNLNLVAEIAFAYFRPPQGRNGKVPSDNYFCFTACGEGYCYARDGTKNLNPQFFLAWVSIDPSRIKYIAKEFMRQFRENQGEAMGDRIKEQVV